MKKILTHWTLAFLTLAVLMLWGLKDPFVKETARLKSFDLIQKYDTPTMSEDVVIVEIDEKSIEQNGQWPWKRTVLADVIWRLREAGAGISSEDGTSESTLSVAISTMVSSISMVSPTSLCQLMMVASATLSPILGMINSTFAM